MLNDTLAHNFNESSVENVVESVRLAAYDPSAAENGKINYQEKFWLIYERYIRVSKELSYDEYICCKKKSAENMLLRRIIASMLGSPQIFDLDLASIGKKIIE